MKKYEKVFKTDYENWRRENAAYRAQVNSDPARLRFHLMPESGWLNDPNGLCQFNGVYHIYYQFTPFEPNGELKMWGHYTTRDFVHYDNEEPVLFPDSDADAHGVYSGSAFVKDGIIRFYYTGNVKYFDRNDYDYINSGRGANEILVESRDGYHMSDKKVLLTNADYPADMSCHVRDPKIFPDENGYDMVLGARDRDGHGCVLVYRSDDLAHWHYLNRIRTKEPFGYMWECPDLFALDGQILLIDCPQGVKPQGLDYANVHQCVVMPLQRGAQDGAFTVQEDGIRQLDRGCDFYAPQSFLDEQGRRILIGWMGIPDADYTNPTTAHGWQHALTIPRELHFRNGRLYQTPIEELKALRGAETRTRFAAGKAQQLSADMLVYEAELTFGGAETAAAEQAAEITVTLREGVTLRYADHVLTLHLGAHGSGRTDRSVRLEQLTSLRIFSDTSSLEIFVNGGEEVFTTRVYGETPELAVVSSIDGEAAVYPLGSFEIAEGETLPH